MGFKGEGDIVAYEALMRPEGRNVLDYIEEMRRKNKLHALELASFFGTTMAYSECFKPIKDKLVIEILEYTEGERWMWKTMEAHTKVYEGIEVSLDDFGTGHNDVDAVDYYNPHTVKLDRSLIEQFHNKGIKILAEGVETEEEYMYMMEAGADYFQGYYLARPK